MNVSVVTRNSLSLPVGLGWTVCAAGALGIVATYWDESWHTDIGRDSFWTPRSEERRVGKECRL